MKQYPEISKILVHTYVYAFDKYRQPIMFKIKSNAWKDKLRGYCQGNEKLYKQLE